MAATDVDLDEYLVSIDSLLNEICQGVATVGDFETGYVEVLLKSADNDLRVPSVVLLDKLSQTIYDHYMTAGCSRHTALDQNPDSDDPLSELLYKTDVNASVYTLVAKELTDSKSNIPVDFMDKIFTLTQCLGPPHLDDTSKKEVFLTPKLESLPMKTRKSFTVKRQRRQFSDVWLSFCKRTLSDNLLERVLFYLPVSVLPHLCDAVLLTDFVFNAYKRGDPFNMFALEAVVCLVLQHHLDYPDFYADVYNMLQPHCCYSAHRERFFRVLNLFLSSSHVPAYMCAAFVKRLSRLLLTAPVHSQVPVQKLIRNVLVRHPALHVMVHRDTTESGDPYAAWEKDPAKCNAIRSSLWELKVKTLQSHWLPVVAEHAHFIDRSLPKMESAIRWRDIDEMWTMEMDKDMLKDPTDIGQADELPPANKRQRLQAQRQKKRKVAVAFVEPQTLF